MIVDDALIDKIALLARLKLTDKEKEMYKAQLTDILDFFENLNKVDTEGVEPISQVTGLQNVSRQDSISSSDIHEDIIKQAPEKSEN